MMERHHQEMAGLQQKVMMMHPMPSSAFTIIELDRDYMARVMLPDLTRHYFDTPQGRQYEVAIVASDNGDVLYRSDDRSVPFRADLVLPIFSVRPLRREPFDGRMPFEPPPAAQSGWQFLVRHHAGSLEEIVGASRRRNLMLTGGILLVLAATVLVLVAMLRGAERLRLQQLEFVAGVTHELNTPVAALTSAGQNLADGIITEPSQVARYGSAIVKESRRLTEMIGQVLAYGGMQSRRKLPHAPVVIESVIDEAVGACRWMAEEQSVVIESGKITFIDATTNVRVGKSVTLDGTRSTGDGTLTCTWSFQNQDGSTVWETATGCKLTKAFQNADTKYVTLTVKDADGDTNASTQSFAVTR